MKQTTRRTMSRRGFLDRAGRVSLVGAALVVAPGCGGQRPACSDPDRLSDGEVGLRVSVAYTEQSPDESLRCSDCSFFEGYSEGSCGTCTLLEGPVNAGGLCDSWSAREVQE